MELPLKIELRKERSFSDKMNGMFTYLSQNFKMLLRCLLFIVGPVALFAGICNGLYQSRLMSIMPFDMQQNAENNIISRPDYFINLFANIFSPLYFLTILLTLAAFVLVNCIVFSHMKLYAESPAAPIQFEDILNEVKSIFIKMFFATVGSTLIVLLGFIFLIIPGIYLAIVFTLLMPVMIIERTGFFDAIKRCFFLIKDKWWSTFGLLIITSFIVQICSMIFYMPMYVFQILRLTKVVGDDMEIWQVLVSVISSVGLIIVSSLMALAIGMQYFNLVERREGKGLRAIIDEIGTGSDRSEKTSNPNDL